MEYPDIQYHFLPVAVSYDGVTTAPTKTGHSFQLHLGHNRSMSRGEVKAVSTDMTVAPKLRFNYMSRDEDWEDWRTALRLTREIIAQPCFDGVRGDEIAPGAAAQVRVRVWSLRCPPVSERPQSHRVLSTPITLAANNLHHHPQNTHTRHRHHRPITSRLTRSWTST